MALQAEKLCASAHMIHLDVFGVYSNTLERWTQNTDQHLLQSELWVAANFFRRERISLTEEKLPTRSRLQQSPHFLLRQDGYCQGPKKIHYKTFSLRPFGPPFWVLRTKTKKNAGRMWLAVGPSWDHMQGQSKPCGRSLAIASSLEASA